MPKCSCAGSACNCLITAGTGISVSGTGNSTSPYVISTSALLMAADVLTSDPLDLSDAGIGSTVHLSLSTDLPEVSFPLQEGALIEVVVRHVVGPTTVTWPAGILWPGGAEPTQSSTAGHLDWFLFRRIGTDWMGTLLAGDVY